VLDKLAEGGSLESVSSAHLYYINQIDVYYLSFFQLVQFGEASVKETSGLSLRRWFWMKTSLVLKRDGLYLSSGIVRLYLLPFMLLYQPFIRIPKRALTWATLSALNEWTRNLIALSFRWTMDGPPDPL
jgi:hypothetical protein